MATLLEFPDLNATFTDTELIRWATVNLGVAVDTPTGLVVPVIRDAQKYGVREIGELTGISAHEAGTAGSAARN